MPCAVDVTIVVSTHNRASTLNRLLTTLLIEQRPGDVLYEVILVDNNSTDDTATIVAPWCRTFPSRLQYIFAPRHGIAYGRNAGCSPAFLRCQDHEFLLRFWGSGEHALYAPELVVRAPIDPERLTIKYHRAWHVRHGSYSALMRAEEMTDRNGCLRPEPLPD